MLLYFLTISLLIQSSVSSFAGNLNYDSPSSHHPGLGISIRKVAKRQSYNSSWGSSELNFTHGVASGDPYDTSVILWTRAAPTMDDDASNITVTGDVPLYNHETTRYVIGSTSPICVKWKIGLGRNFSQIADSGTAFTSSDIDYTIKVQANNLTPYTNYYYQFQICNSNITSPLGQTKTIPSPGAKVPGSVKLAVYSCNNWPFGFFNAYGNPVRKNSVDYVVFLGDYIYEYAPGQPAPQKNHDHGWGWSIGRVSQPEKEIFSLYDYRKRIASYRTDLDLLASHQRYPWIQVWDDHEVADNEWLSGSSGMNNTEESFINDGGVSVDQRKMNAVRAYFEWMPIRQVDMDDNLRIWRSFAFGDLFDLIMLDTRHYDRDITDLYWNTDYVHEISNEASRSLMGSRQENWFYNQLKQSKARGARWRLIGNQVVFAHIDQSWAFGKQNPIDYDAWGGYAANRNRTLKTLYENNIGNTIFLSGDSHASWVSDVAFLGEHPYDPVTGHGAMGVEFAGTAVSSPSQYVQNITLHDGNLCAQAFIANNMLRELQWQDTFYRGYYEMSVDYDSINASYFGLPTIAQRLPYEISLANFTVKNGANHLHRYGASVVKGNMVESGALKYGFQRTTNMTNNTMNGHYLITSYQTAISG